MSFEINIVGFAGGGGSSLGMEMAGRRVDIAVNHDKQAMSMHKANHPNTEHFPEDILNFDVVKATRGRPVGDAWLSPDCRDFSIAKGGKPVSKRVRGLAWVAIHWIRKLGPVNCPKRIYLENVKEFQGWCPLNKKGKRKNWRKGWLFQCFIGALQRRGYIVEWRELCMADYGVPTSRKRLFLIARRDGQPIVWPKPTHASPESEEVKAGTLKPYSCAADCIDFFRPCPSIFMTRREARKFYKQTGIRIKRPLARGSKKRIAKGVMREIVNCADPFILPLTHHGKGRYYELNDLLPTVTGAHRGELALVLPFLTEFANARHERNFNVKKPFRTQCAQIKGGHFALAMTYVMKMRGSNLGHGIRRPLQTVSAAGTHFAEVRAFLIKYNKTGGSIKLTEPMHTVSTEDRFAIVMVAGQKYAIADIGIRMLVARELFRAMGFPDSYIIGNDARQGLKLSTTAQVKMCGNSVCPPIAEAIIRANTEQTTERMAA